MFEKTPKVYNPTIEIERFLKILWVSIISNGCFKKKVKNTDNFNQV